MKKVIPDGRRIKSLRINSERGSTQKELAHEIRVSERTLRQIENQDAPISIDVLDRLTKWFDVHREQIAKSSCASATAAAPSANVFDSILSELSEERLVPRHDYDLAYATTDEGILFKEASRSHDVVCSIEIPLTDEVARYAKDLFEVLRSLTWEVRDCRFDVRATDEIDIRRRIKMLLVLLKGNDIWTYQTSFLRRLPERYEPLPEGENPDLKFRLVVALGPPGEYGEETIKVPIDHGQPFFLPGWNFDKESGDGSA